MFFDRVGTVLFTLYFLVCLTFIFKKKNIFYPRYEGSVAVIQGMIGIIGGVLWIIVFALMK
jgi:hypothetical protein